MLQGESDPECSSGCTSSAPNALAVDDLGEVSYFPPRRRISIFSDLILVPEFHDGKKHTRIGKIARAGDIDNNGGWGHAFDGMALTSAIS